MIRLVYVSTSSRELSTGELMDILQKSRLKNTLCDITGLLLYRGGNFLHILEGPNNEVLSVYDAICRDERNMDHIVIEQSPIEQRSFPNWSMAFRNLHNSTQVEIDGYSHILDDETTLADLAVYPDKVRALISMFRDLMH